MTCNVESSELEWTNDISLNVDMLTDSKVHKHEEGNNVSNMDKIKFTTLFHLRHGDKKALIDWCMQMGLITSAYFCAKCDKSMKLTEKKGSSDGYEWRCRVYDGANIHVSSRSVRTGSWFFKSKMNMCDILMIAHCWVYRIPREWVILETGISQHSVCDWYNSCRDVCSSICAITMIGGANKTVEIEETLFDKKKYKGEYVDGIFVLGGVEKGSTKCFFKVIENRNSASLFNIIKSSILPGTKVISHCWKAYNSLEDENFIDSIKNNEYSFKKTDTGSSSTFGGLWRALKHFIPPHIEDFDAYLAEYAWRKGNCSSNDKMKTFIEALKIVFPLHTRDICE